VYYAEAAQDTVFTSMNEQLAGNYVKAKLKGGYTTEAEHQAYIKVMDGLDHTDNCFCDFCILR
jgi:tRNA A37 methylthiotransferase MiaB